MNESPRVPVSDRVAQILSGPVSPPPAVPQGRRTGKFTAKLLRLACITMTENTVVAPVAQRENYHYHGQAQPAAIIANPPLYARGCAPNGFISKSAPPSNKHCPDLKSSPHDERKNEPSDFFRADSCFRTSVLRHLLTWSNEAGRRCKCCNPVL